MKRYTTLIFTVSLTLVGYTQNPPTEDDFFNQLSNAAIELTKTKTEYDPSYFAIDYPNGDIPSHLGVNADVIIRAYRKVGIDLQQKVHEDILENQETYGLEKWGQTEADTNIDHRRVPNLQIFFSRKGVELPIDQENETYKAGDIVVWQMDNSKPHIGIVTNKKSPYGTPLMVHNSTSGQRLQNVLFHFKIIGHYRYGKEDKKSSNEVIL